MICKHKYVIVFTSGKWCKDCGAIALDLGNIGVYKFVAPLLAKINA